LNYFNREGSTAGSGKARGKLRMRKGLHALGDGEVLVRGAAKWAWKKDGFNFSTRNWGTFTVPAYCDTSAQLTGLFGEIGKPQLRMSRSGSEGKRGGLVDDRGRMEWEVQIYSKGIRRIIPGRGGPTVWRKARSDFRRGRGWVVWGGGGGFGIAV